MATFEYSSTSSDSSESSDEEREESIPFSSRYEVLEKLGEGGFGAVHKCREIRTHELYAVKMINNVNISRLEIINIENEIMICRQVNHPNIVKFIRSIEDAYHYYLVFELITGGELLDDIIRRVSYTERDAAHYVSQILQAVSYLHSIDICHRDLKLENILLARPTLDSELKIIDFGTATVFKGDEMHWRGWAGSTLYYSPEMLQTASYGKPIDIWAIGVIMYILLIGYPPFFDLDDSTLFPLIISGEFLVDFEWDILTLEAKDLIQKMLTVNPCNRITAADALKHDWLQRQMQITTNFHRSDTIDNLKRFNARRKMKGAILTTIGAGKMFRLKGATSGQDVVPAHGSSASFLRQLLNKLYSIATSCVIS